MGAFSTYEVLRYSLNESPSEKEGKCSLRSSLLPSQIALNESPSEKEGKSPPEACHKVAEHIALNESPSEKEGKCMGNQRIKHRVRPSMKVPPKRKGN